MTPLELLKLVKQLHGILSLHQFPILENTPFADVKLGPEADLKPLKEAMDMARKVKSSLYIGPAALKRMLDLAHKLEGAKT